MPLTTEQQQTVVDNLPMARRLAARFGGEQDDELYGVADEALCVYVTRFKASYGVSVSTYLWRKVALALFRHVRRERKRRKLVSPLIDATNPCKSPSADLSAILDRLPKLYRRLAYLRWVQKRNLREIAKETHLPRRKVATYLRRAERLALLLVEDVPEL